MSEITGVVQKIEARDVAGGKKAYNIVVAGQSYGAGLYAPKCKEGDYVKFGVDESRGYKNVERGTLKVSANKPPAEAVAEAAATKPVVSLHGDKQDTISRQAASNTAIAWIEVLAANEALGLPAAGGKGKGTRQEAMDALLRKYEQQFYENNTGVPFKDISPRKEAEVDDVAVDNDAPVDDDWA